MYPLLYLNAKILKDNLLLVKETQKIISPVNGNYSQCCKRAETSPSCSRAFGIKRYQLRLVSPVNKINLAHLRLLTFDL